VAHVAAQVGKLYGCDEVEVYFPKGYKYVETVRIK